MPDVKLSEATDLFVLPLVEQGSHLAAPASGFGKIWAESTGFWIRRFGGSAVRLTTTTDLATKADTSHTHVAADITDFSTAVTTIGDADYAALSHTHAASDVTSGQLALARGGTNTDLSATGGSNQVLKQSTVGGNITVATLVAGDIPSLAASKITSGQLALAQGGTNADLSATGGSNQFLKQTSSGAAVTVAAISAADITSALASPPAIGGTTPAAGKFTTTTTQDFTLTKDGGVSFINWTNASDNPSHTPQLSFRKARGSIASPTAVQANDYIIVINGTIHDGTTYAANSGIHVKSSENATTSARGCYMVFLTTVTGSISATEKMRLHSNGYFGIGQASPTTLLHATLDSTNTNAVDNVATFGANSTGTAAAGFGPGVRLTAESSTTNNTSQVRLRSEWTTATHASRKARGTLSAYDTAERDCIMWEASGTAAMLGFYGTAPIVKPAPAGSRGGNAALASLLTALANLGLITDSTST